MYNMITGRSRTLSSHEWEWLKTWYGQAFMWLLFDVDRPENDQLISQYGLLPVPFSIWGESCLAGKTENCMCHPDCRGNNIYVPHEERSFVEAKEIFDLFFTTTGNVSGGKVGAIRHKLGYVSFDAWVYYLRFLGERGPKAKNVDTLFGIKLPMAPLMVKFLSLYSGIFNKRVVDVRLEVYDKNEAPLEEIERFWMRNKECYGITVNRTSAYLDWRINRNPHANHRYLIFREHGQLMGYLIFVIDRSRIAHIVDIVADQKNKNNHIPRSLVKGVVSIASDENAVAVSFSTTEGNNKLGKAFLSNGFVSTSLFFHLREILKGVNRKQFFVFVPENRRHIKGILDPKSWYMTDLVKEGFFE
jgi:hypothetical protein